jgi:DNA-binding response OmpR family regulator
MNMLLLVEDDPNIAKIIEFYLCQESKYEVTIAASAEEALAKANKPYDIVLLDIMLPDVDGVALCEKLRESQNCPIIFISCIDDEDTIVRALEMGGDDYLTKPFNFKILQARIEANLRRVKMERGELSQPKLEFPDFSIDMDRSAIRRDGKLFPLGPIELGLLMHLVDNPGRIVTTEELYESVWGTHCFGDLRTVFVHIYNLRKKLEKNPGTPIYIKNVRGKGYIFDPDGAA